MDPILKQLAADLSRAAANDPSLTREELDAYVKEVSGGRYSITDVFDTSINARNMGRSAAQGLTMSWGDELLGMFDEDAKHEMRLRERLFKEDHAVADAVGNIVGTLPTLLIPGGAVAAGARGAAAGTRAAGVGLRAAVGRGAATGILAGAAQGAGMANEGGRARGAVGGAIAGGVVGAAIPGVVGGAKLLYSPTHRASRRLAHAINESGGVDAVRRELDRAVAAGRGNQVMLGDLSDRLALEADFAASADDGTLVDLGRKLKRRQAGQSQRLLNDVRGQVGDPVADHVVEDLAQRRRAWADGPDGFGGIDKDLPVKLGDESYVLDRKPLQQAYGLARMAGDIAESPLDEIARTLAEGGPRARPRTFGDLQQLQRILKDRTDRAYREGNGELGAAYKTLRQGLIDTMEQAVPGYRAKNATYRQMRQMERAVQTGVEMMNLDDSRKLVGMLRGMKPAEREMAKLGMASEMIKRLENSSTNRDVAKQLLDMSPAMERRVRLLFGSKAELQKFMERVQIEGEVFRRLKGAVGGSQTTRRLTAQGFDPAELGIDIAATGGAGLLARLTSAFAGTTGGALARRTAAEMGPKLTAQGAPTIMNLIRTFEATQPVVGRIPTRVMPVAAVSLFDF